MESKSLKDRLLSTIAASREREHELLAMCDDSPPPEPDVWTVKDHLAHLTWWRIYAAHVLDAARTGSDPPLVADDDDVQNTEIYAANRENAADDVKEGARSSYHTLEAAVSACSEADLLKPHPRAPDAPVWRVVPGNGHSHLGQHLWFWHAEQDDEEAAEAAQTWVYDLDRAEFPEPKSVAVATYNLGCFYSRIGRADEALYRFKQAFELDPSLKKLAQTDPDLDRIRNHPELVALIG